MPPATIYVDCDDVLCETARSLTGLLERHFGRTVAFEDIHAFDLGLSFQLNPAELARLMDLAHEPDFLGSLPPIPGAVEVLARLMAAGHEVHIVTGRPPGTRPASEAWLRRHAVPHNRLLFVDKYGRNGGNGDGTVPLATIARSPYALAVEDAPSMIRFLLAHSAIPVAIMNRPWNRHEAFSANGSPHRIHRCRDWTDVLACALPSAGGDATVRRL